MSNGKKHQCTKMHAHSECVCVFTSVAENICASSDPLSMLCINKKICSWFSSWCITHACFVESAQSFLLSELLTQIQETIYTSMHASKCDNHFFSLSWYQQMMFKTMCRQSPNGLYTTYLCFIFKRDNVFRWCELQIFTKMCEYTSK